jgi:hypothetical protein
MDDVTVNGEAAIDIAMAIDARISWCRFNHFVNLLITANFGRFLPISALVLKTNQPTVWQTKTTNSLVRFLA